MDNSRKRKAETSSNNAEGATKRSKGGKKWRVPRKGCTQANTTAQSIEPGDSGIWATCDMHKEGKCMAELNDIFSEYTEKIYGNPLWETQELDGKVESDEVDIEAEISKEVAGMKRPKSAPLFQPVKVDVQCGMLFFHSIQPLNTSNNLVMFFKTREPVQTVSLVHRICSDAFESSSTKRSRWVKRLTPMTMMGKATEKGLQEVCAKVLRPSFLVEGAGSRKFAIRTTIRNHNTLTRDGVIKQVADAVGPSHTVDLKNYDLLILVEIYKNICGMSVVGSDFDKLKRFNLAEIYDPTPKPT
ncbi:THUMP [Lasallia pustulata]|uniref:THUMP n=1 Tax=Lasallia pustulata TaxID=136370 RepID=A0A1W5D070_9LECA|nr:THUMP [Lasallia pustulata]